jgi:hypothetical protein
MDETFVRIAGRWLYLFRAVDNYGETVDFYPLGDTGSGSGQVFSAEGVGQSGQ